jgi:hypothetical protein
LARSLARRPDDAAAARSWRSLTVNGHDDDVPPLAGGGAQPTAALDRFFVGARSGEQFG